MVKSDVTLAITSAPDGEALYDGLGTVYGTVGLANCAITVNGVATNADEYGNWAVENVPIFGLGTATFDVVATPAGAPAVQLSLEKDKPPAIRVTQHYVKQTFTWTNNANHTDSTWVKSYRAAYEADANGQWRLRYQGTATSSSSETLDGISGSWTTDYAWSDTNSVGTYHTVSNPGGEQSGEISAENWLVKTVPDKQLDHTEGDNKFYVQHYYAKGVHHQWNSSGGNSDLTLSAGTQSTHYIGSKGKPGARSLNGVTVEGIGYGKPDAPIWNHTPASVVPAGAKTLNGNPVNENSREWTLQADGARRTLLVMARTEPNFQVTNSAGSMAWIIGHLRKFIGQQTMTTFS